MTFAATLTANACRSPVSIISGNIRGRHVSYSLFADIPCPAKPGRIKASPRKLETPRQPMFQSADPAFLNRPPASPGRNVARLVASSCDPRIFRAAQVDSGSIVCRRVRTGFPTAPAPIVSCRGPRPRWWVPLGAHTRGHGSSSSRKSQLKISTTPERIHALAPNQALGL